jgi:type III restriction enzyme
VPQPLPSIVDRALCIPYEMDGEQRPMYPDFLIIRSEDGGLVVDIIEPHTISLADAPAKAAGPAKFVAQHADKFGRIELIIVDGKVTKRLELTDETVRNKVRVITLPTQLRQLFADS